MTFLLGFLTFHSYSSGVGEYSTTITSSGFETSSHYFLVILAAGVLAGLAAMWRDRGIACAAGALSVSAVLVAIIELAVYPGDAGVGAYLSILTGLVTAALCVYLVVDQLQLTPPALGAGPGAAGAQQQPTATTGTAQQAQSGPQATTGGFPVQDGTTGNTGQHGQIGQHGQADQHGQTGQTGQAGWGGTGEHSGH